jgi:hypothetical protein
MTNQEIDQLAKVLKTFIEEEREITKDMHIKHHAFIAHLKKVRITLNLILRLEMLCLVG